MIYILLIVTRFTSLQPSFVSLSEFQSRESCEVALGVAKEFFTTVNDESKCIDVKDEIKKIETKKKLLKELEEFKK